MDEFGTLFSFFYSTLQGGWGKLCPLISRQYKTPEQLRFLFRGKHSIISEYFEVNVAYNHDRKSNIERCVYLPR
jgi:hypothetical protein